MLPLLGSLNRAFEKLDLHFGFPRRIALYLLVHLPHARHHVGLNTGGNVRKQLRRRRTEKDETSDDKLESWLTYLLFNSGDDLRALPPQKLCELTL